MRSAVALLLLGWPLAAAAEPVVMLDPGHGGSNQGAFGPEAGRHEKQLTLELARRCQLALRRLLPEARVVLTRGDDRYLTLAERVRRANSARATLFVSLHLNASPSRSEQGFQTYVLSAEASDREARRLAWRENRHDGPGHGGGGAAEGQASDVDRRQDDLRAIVTEVRQRSAQRHAARLAAAIHRALTGLRGRERDRGLRQAPFDVLMGLEMPGVLVELGHIDHPVEGPELARAETQTRLAEALASGIARHVRGEGAAPGTRSRRAR
ncbi:MAG: N-acetylmuramoyl-L-alanine amidase [Deltaproteobacteria bacterium]|nr:N-acetylmuramoyl-L-alanine amidase [Deltaproteobacteria bacterium]